MIKLAFLGAGSTVFAKAVIGDCLMVDELKDMHVSLIDIDAERLEDSRLMVENLNRSLGAKATIEATLDRRKGLAGADFVVNAIQVGGYKPSTVIDFKIPKKFGLEQTIADTLGIGGIFRALRTIPVMLEVADDMMELCPDAWMLNYTNPMGMITGALQKGTDINIVGLCHSVQHCAEALCRQLDLPDDNLQSKIAGINHQGWLLEITRDGEDLYPEIRKRAERKKYKKKNAVRFEIMKWFGYFVTESSEHSAEYVPWFIKRNYPELIDTFHIPLDEYPRRCRNQIKAWKKQRKELTQADKPLEHKRSHEYASRIIHSMITGTPYKIGGNVPNKNLIANLPYDCCVEVPCLVDRSGVTPCYVGDLPPQCAALTRTNVNVQQLTIEAALTRKKEHIYQAAMLDPHTAAELSIDDIVKMCNRLIKAHGDYLPTYE